MDPLQWPERFPGAIEVAIGEGGAVYAAQAEGDWWLISDERTVADLLDDPDVAEYVRIRRFDDEKSWQVAIADAGRLASAQPARQRS